VEGVPTSSLRLAVVLLLVPIVLLAGCGGGSRLSNAEYAKRADTICQAYRLRVSSLTPHTFTEVVAYVDQTLPVLEDGLRKLHRLSPPKDEAGLAAKWLATGDAEASALRDLKTAARRKDGVALREIIRNADAGTRRGHALARQLGLTACASS
jgi:hypothetical protein